MTLTLTTYTSHLALTGLAVVTHCYIIPEIERRTYSLFRPASHSSFNKHGILFYKSPCLVLAVSAYVVSRLSLVLYNPFIGSQPLFIQIILRRLEDIGVFFDCPNLTP